MTEAARAQAHDTIIEQSWSRCRDYGLTHQSPPCFDPPPPGELSALLESRQALVQTTHQEVLPYYGTILANSNCLIMLADEQGRLLQSWGDQRFIEPRQAAGFVAGASWLERYTGTNAIGTALSCGQAVHIQHDEHFLKANRFMTGSASPIFDEQRRMVAVLDVSSDSYLPPAHTLGMVKMMSQSVENRLILKLFAEQYHLLSFNTSLDNLDSPWAAYHAYWFSLGVSRDIDQTGAVDGLRRRALRGGHAARDLAAADDAGFHPRHRAVLPLVDALRHGQRGVADLAPDIRAHVGARRRAGSRHGTHGGYRPRRLRRRPRM